MVPRTGDESSVYVAITGLTSDATEPELRAMLKAFGSVRSYVRPTSAATGRTGTVAYAEMAPNEAEAAVRGLDGRERKGHIMKMSITSAAAPDMEPADRRAQGSRPRRIVLAPSQRRSGLTSTP
jgi:hypothetical protein